MTTTQATRKTIRLTAEQVAEVKGIVNAMAPWTKRAGLRWSINASVNPYAHSPEFGTTNVVVEIGESRWQVRQFGTAGQYNCAW